MFDVILQKDTSWLNFDNKVRRFAFNVLLYDQPTAISIIIIGSCFRGYIK